MLAKQLPCNSPAQSFVTHILLLAQVLRPAGWLECHQYTQEYLSTDCFKTTTFTSHPHNNGLGVLFHILMAQPLEIPFVRVFQKYKQFECQVKTELCFLQWRFLTKHKCSHARKRVETQEWLVRHPSNCGSEPQCYERRQHWIRAVPDSRCDWKLSCKLLYRDSFQTKKSFGCCFLQVSLCIFRGLCCILYLHYFS